MTACSLETKMTDRLFTSGNSTARSGDNHSFSLKRKALRAMVAGLGFALVSLCGTYAPLAQDKTSLATARLNIPGVSKDGKSASNPSELSGFQRKGNTLVGEVKTREGAVLRLVFDARSHVLIGMRVLDPPSPASAGVVASSACPDQTSSAPLPITLSPAN